MDSFEKVRKYAEQVATKQYHTDSPLGKTAYEKKLQSTHDQLRSLVKQQRELLDSLRSKQQPSTPTDGPEEPSPQLQRIREIESAKTAYENLCNKKPFLPRPDSSLPALVTLRKVHTTISEFKTLIPESAERIKDANYRLEEEHATKRALLARRDELSRRVSALKDGVDQVSASAPSDPNLDTTDLEARIQATQTRIKESTRSRNDLQRSLDAFISTRLAPLLAIEDLGGPQVGESLEDSESVLRELLKARDEPRLALPDFAEPSASKPSKKRKGKGKATPPPEVHLMDSNENENAMDIENLDDEIESTLANAETEMSDLLSELMNVFIEDGPEAWVELTRGISSAAYLERLGVLERKDGLFVRLVNFVEGW